MPKPTAACPTSTTVAAVHDGMIRRMPGNIGVYIVVNNANEHVRFRYLHMNPKTLDADGMVNGRQVSEGEIIGKVATWGDYENGTSYHIHFNIQVFTNIGWVWVNPYMTLVAAYERLIGGRGTRDHAGRAGAAGSRQAAGDPASDAAGSVRRTRTRDTAGQGRGTRRARRRRASACGIAATSTEIRGRIDALASIVRAGVSDYNAAMPRISCNGTAARAHRLSRRACLIGCARRRPLASRLAQPGAAPRNARLRPLGRGFPPARAQARHFGGDL